MGTIKNIAMSTPEYEFVIPYSLDWTYYVAEKSEDDGDDMRCYQYLKAIV